MILGIILLIFSIIFFILAIKSGGCLFILLGIILFVVGFKYLKNVETHNNTIELKIENNYENKKSVFQDSILII